MVSNRKEITAAIFLLVIASSIRVLHKETQAILAALEELTQAQQERDDFRHRSSRRDNASTTNNGLNQMKGSRIAESPRRRRIWHCGWASNNIRRSLFPDFEPAGQFHENVSAHESDLVFYGMFGPCDISTSGLNPKANKHEWFWENFTGKVLFNNGESYGDVRGPNTYQIGWSPQGVANASLRSIPTLYLTYFLFQRADPAPLLRNIYDPSQRPVSNQKYPVVYMASNCVEFREKAMAAISNILPVHFGGKCHGDGYVPQSKHNGSTAVVQRIPEDYGERSNHGNNVNLFQNYRFCLVMENTSKEGYVTEKIALAFLGGCVPIYYGTLEIFKVFNKESFVFYDIDNPQPALDRIKYLEENRTAYNETQKQPILADGNKTLEGYFSFSDEIGNGVLKRRIRSLLGIID